MSATMRMGILSLAVLALGGCVKASLDRGVGYGGRPQDVAVEDVPVTGHDVVVRFHDNSKLPGELLAVDLRQLWLRTDEGTRALGRESVEEVNVVLYATHTTWLWIWAGVLTASMVTHGWWAAVSLPVAAPGAILTAATSGLFNKLRVKQAQLGELYQYARYPAGMPQRAPERLPFVEPRPAPPVSRPASAPSRPSQTDEADEPGVAPR